MTDAASSQPIGGVKACAVNTDEAEPWVCVHTDASGRYKMTVAEAGHFVVELTVPPHSPYIARTFYGGEYSKSDASVLTIASGSTTADVDVQLLEGGRITGTVTDALTGLPVEAVEVCARGETPTECVWTNPRGEYTVSQLASGSYAVEFGFGYGGSQGEMYAPEYYNDLVFFQASEPTRVSVSAGATTTGIDAEMHHWGKLAGRVTSASTHAPIEGVEVDAYDGSQHTAVTNTNGEYTISHLGNRSGEYTVSFSPRSGEGLDFFPQWYDDKESQLESDPVHVSLDHTTSEIDAALEEGGQITGRVTDVATKQPLAEITVCAWSKIVFESRCAWTNSEGEYAIVRLPADEYQVSFYTNSDNYYSEGYSEQVAVTLGHATAGIDVAMEPVVKGTIMGSVREAVWAKPIPNIDVCAYDIEQEELFGECTTSNSAGWYELRGLSAGQYVVEFSSPGPGLEYATQYYDKKPNPLYAEPVAVTEGKFISGIEGSLEKAGDASGRVTNTATGKPLQGIDVCYYARTEYLVGCILTNATGEYSTPPVASGEYRVLFASPFESGLNYAAQFYGGVASINDSPYVTIQAGKLTTGVDAQMAAGGSITGEVTDASSGKRLEGALVCALAPGFGEVGACVFTHADGRYTIRGLDSGKYPVIFEAEGYKWQYYDDVELSSQAQPVGVSAGATSEDIDAALQPTADQSPSNLVPPTISGNAAVGNLLECSSGTWAGSPTPTYTYTWLDAARDVGSGSTYRVTPQDAEATLQCEVTAQNPAGVAVAYSNPVEVGPSNEPSRKGVTPLPPPPPVPVVRPVLPPATIDTPPTTGSPTTPDPSVDTTDQAAPAAAISSSGAVYTYSGRRGETFVDSGELVHCPVGTLPCQIALEVTAGSNTRKRLLAFVQLNVPAGEVERLKFKLDATGTALLRDLKRIHATIVSTMHRRGTKPITLSRTILLRSPPSHGHRP